MTEAPKYYVELDYDERAWNVMVITYDKNTYDKYVHQFVADFSDRNIAEATAACMNDVVKRCFK